MPNPSCGAPHSRAWWSADRRGATTHQLAALSKVSLPQVSAAERALAADRRRILATGISLKVLSHGGPSRTTRREMTPQEARGYHHVYDERESETVTLTWPRSIPLKEGDRGWADMKMIEQRLPEFAHTPVLLLWAPDDNVFPIEFAHRLKELLPHAEGPITFDRARHFLQDDRGPDLAKALVEFLIRLDRGKGARA